MKSEPDEVPNLSIDHIKILSELLDGEWHLMRPSLKKAAAIWQMKWSRIVDYRYLQPLENEKRQRMEVRLHKRMVRYFLPERL